MARKQETVDAVRRAQALSLVADTVAIRRTPGNNFIYDTE